MFKSLLRFFLFASPLLHSVENNPSDQLLVIFGSSGYVLYKVIDFANDHGFRYVKILSYEFSAFEHTIQGKTSPPPPGGRFFELKDDHATVSFLCFEKPPEDPYIIDVDKYRFIIDRVVVPGE